MTDASRVLVAIRVRAPAERAFTAFTEQIDQWWQPNGLFRFTDGTEFVVGDVRVWQPPRRLVVGWRQAGFTADQDTELQVTFEEIAGDAVQTRVTVEHFGWDRIPPEHVARHGFPLAVFQLRFAEWWQAQLTALSERVTS